MDTILCQMKTIFVYLRLDSITIYFKCFAILVDMSAITLVIGENYYNKDPQSSDLGKKIIEGSVMLIDELGFEQFTFKKLAQKINSTEASIYRYFDNKLKLLVYLTTWYWAWVEYLIDFRTHHMNDAQEKLKQIIDIICHVNNDYQVELAGVDINILRQIVVRESDKTYLTKQVDEINHQGLFMVFKGLCHKIALVVKEIKPDYAHPHSLVSTMVEASHQQAFFSEHLPRLTEIKRDSSEKIEQQVAAFVRETFFKVLR